MIAEGRVTQAEGDLLALADELALPGSPRGALLPSEALEEERAEDPR
ncbi:MAG: hypothetical protein JO265_05815 [Acidimicrobiia bacterium]|nr:hypothetical protein [Acidimicrobiia bacterium]